MLYFAILWAPYVPHMFFTTKPNFQPKESLQLVQRTQKQLSFLKHVEKEFTFSTRVNTQTFSHYVQVLQVPLVLLLESLIVFRMNTRLHFLLLIVLILDHTK